MARAAESVGFDSVWVGDHYLFRDPGMAPRGPWESWTLMAGLAAATERVELGPLVASVSFHNPAVLAKMAATIDEISGGRLILGLGAGWNEVEYRAFGIPFDHRVDRFEEAFGIIRGLLRHGHVDLEGRYHQARDCVLVPRGPRPQGPPIFLGTMGERMLRLAAAHADGWNAWFAWFGNRPEGLAELRTKVDRACADVGRDPATMERSVALLIRIQPGESSRRGGPEEVVEPLQGSPDELAAALTRFADEGIGHVQLVLDPITLGSIERMGAVLEALDRVGSGSGGSNP